MQEDFHYYATYCASIIAGYSHEESQVICYSAQLADWFTRTLLSGIGGPLSAATTQLKMEMMDVRTDLIGLQDITRIWASFHFLPRDLYADVKKGSKKYKNKYRLICGPNGSLVAETVELAKDSSLQAVGLAMHVLADTWAHRYFAGTPSLVINNTNYHFFELIPEGDSFQEKQIVFRHDPVSPDDVMEGKYTSSIFQNNENTIMNLGHGRAGHLPDYSFIRYKYMPAWADYEEVIKDNPSDYYHAFCQMIYAMKYLKGTEASFQTETYDFEAAEPYHDRIREILEKRQILACDDWKAFGEELSGCEIEDFDLEKYQPEYKEAEAEKKDDTFLGKYILAALAQKSMVTNKIWKSGNRLAGVSVEYNEKGLRGIQDYWKLLSRKRSGKK